MTKFNLKTYVPLEKDIQKAILDYLNLKGIFCWKEHSGGLPVDNGQRFIPIGLRGKSDILGIIQGGRFLAIEVKRPKGKVSVEQRLFLEKINEKGGIAFVATSVDDVIAQGI